MRVLMATSSVFLCRVGGHTQHAGGCVRYCALLCTKNGMHHATSVISGGRAPSWRVDEMCRVR